MPKTDTKGKVSGEESRQDSQAYIDKKQRLQRLLTVFGRKPVLEALQDSTLTIFKLHLAESNKPDGIIKDILRCAGSRDIPVAYHSKQALSRISKNAKQDQGVALDIECERFLSADAFLAKLPSTFSLIALDNVTNPQNVGMIIRSVAASPMTGLLLPEQGCATLDALVIKASAGTLFRAPIIRCRSLLPTLEKFADLKTQLVGLDLKAAQSLRDFQASTRCIYILGNETSGVSKAINALCTNRIVIPMNNGVESLNVSVTASLLAFRSAL